MPSSAPSSRRESSTTSILESCTVLCRRIQDIAEHDPSLVLHRNKWRCLARSYSLVLDGIVPQIKHAQYMVQQSVAEKESFSHKLAPPLEVLYHVIQQGERCLEDCCRRTSNIQIWLGEKALRLGMSTDIVDLHLHDLIWCYFVIKIALMDAESFNMDLLYEMRKLTGIWAGLNSIIEDDLHSTLDLLIRVKANEEGDTRSLAEFISCKLFHTLNEEAEGNDVLPDYMWVASEKLRRDHDAIGEGGYGTVHATEWLGARFAVKDFFYVEDDVEFGREAVIQARLRHPNVMHLVCCSKHPALNKCSLVMELMQQDLRALMIERTSRGLNPPFPLLVAIDLMLQIARGMEYLHKLHIMHRDLKSSNLLISFPTGQSDSLLNLGACLKIADFGMAKSKHASTKFTTKQRGTTPWRAPELFDNDAGELSLGDNPGQNKYSKKGDVYSFSLVCYEILTGKLPFEDQTQIRRRVMAGERPLLPKHCPLALASYIQRCWHREPLMRPSFSEICRMLRYFKASILLGHHHDHGAAKWLNCALSSGMCACIESMLKCIKVSLSESDVLCHHPLPLSIPLEMYCCRMVLQEEDEAQTNGAGGGPPEVEYSTTESVRQEIPPPTAVLSTKQMEYFNYEVIGRFVNAIPRRMKSLLRLRPKPSEFQVAFQLPIRSFTYKELSMATRGFSNRRTQGGAFAYDGTLVSCGQEVYIVEPLDDDRGYRELLVACHLRHKNLLQILGWCKDRKAGAGMFLVYESMPNGILLQQDRSLNSAMTWERRYRALIQLASALKYLHQDTGYGIQIIHRNVTADNIFLDSEYNARLGGYGDASILRNGVPDSGASQSVVGTVGYIAPETLSEGLVTPASDVYAFGVTMLVVACGRIPFESEEARPLRDRVWSLYKADQLMDAADPQMGEGLFDEVQMRRVLQLGLHCSREDPDDRPSVEDVLKILLGESEPGLMLDSPPIYTKTVKALSSYSSGSVSPA